MILKCVSRYSSTAGSFEVGAEIHVQDAIGEFLLRDSPGSFEVVKAPAPATSAPRGNTRG